MKFIPRREPEYFKDLNLSIDNYQRYFRQIRPDIIREFNNKCGYCECDLNLTSLPNIDNFYPKSIYPEKAFEWNNLILCCQVCNISKANRFPQDENGNSLLINPSIENPDEHIELDANSGLLNGLTEKGKVTISTLGLNRQELVEFRRRNENVQQIQSLFPSINIEQDRNTIYQTFIDNTKMISDVNSKLKYNSNEDTLIAYLLYANIITSLETYLADIFINTIFHNTLYLRKFVETYPKFKGNENGHKFTLSEIYNKYDKIEEIVTDEILGIIYHNLQTIKPMFKDTFEVQFPKDMRNIFIAIQVRHDIVHRNGKTKIDKETKSFTEHTIGKVEIENLIIETSKFVEEIDKQMMKL
ncbi:hypothetical protein DR864_06270 [Runella rosea]|uniref:Uncharacterized protein n=1 Tax=Runella rosea TaxID=2259595 RepID=A0A344TFE2_9BACT|nr:HNH endonuclease domain-containing protein [Runella rosea]AXE17363.1 hypothetical protein DR864_06270 [Runella rosea]